MDVHRLGRSRQFDELRVLHIPNRLGYDKKRANELMMQVHTEGKAAVSSGEKDKVEADVKKLQIAGLWATMQQAG